MKWYEFRQNNSGGSFYCDEEVCKNVFIEAENEDAANAKAEGLSIYFDGTNDGRDCDCCGDRWHRADAWSVVDTSKQSIEEIAQIDADHYGWTSPDARLFYANGKVKEIFTKEK